MTAREAPLKRTVKRTKTIPTSADSAADQAKQPTRKRTEQAPNAAKVVRKGRQLTAGARLRRELTQKSDSFDRTVLITQAARIADRLEVIARLLSGDPAGWLAVKVAGQVATVVVTDLVREERQQSEVLRKIIMDLQRKSAGGKGGAGDGDSKSVDPVARIVSEHYGKRRA